MGPGTWLSGWVDVMVGFVVMPLAPPSGEEASRGATGALTMTLVPLSAPPPTYRLGCAVEVARLLW